MNEFFDDSFNPLCVLAAGLETKPKNISDIRDSESMLNEP